MLKNKTSINVLILLAIFFVFGGFKTEIKKDIPDLELYAKKYLATFLNRDEPYFLNKILLNEIDSMASSINRFEQVRHQSNINESEYYKKKLLKLIENEKSKFYRIHRNLAEQNIMLNYNDIKFLTSTYDIEKTRSKAIYLRGKINIYFESKGNIYTFYLNNVFLIDNEWRLGELEINKKESTTLSNIQVDSTASIIDSAVINRNSIDRNTKGKSNPSH